MKNEIKALKFTHKENDFYLCLVKAKLLVPSLID
jgi:hypothetical protein